MTQEAHDFGLQLMTTVSTLVVAVAGFYFGSRAVSQATTTVSDQLRLARSYSRRGVVGTQPEPDVETQEAAGEALEDELGAIEETDEDVDSEPAVDDTETAPGGQETSETGETDGGDDGQDLDADDTEPEADATDEDGEPPAQQPQQPPT
jgi:hypothetical protein